MAYPCFPELLGPGVPPPPPPEEYIPPAPIVVEVVDMGVAEIGVRVSSQNSLIVASIGYSLLSITGSYTILADSGSYIYNSIDHRYGGPNPYYVARYPLSDGYLVDVTIRSGNAGIVSGDTYCLIYLAPSTSASIEQSKLLAAGYVLYELPVNFPRSGIRPPDEGPGMPTSVYTGSFPVGSEISWTSDSYSLYRIEYVIIDFVTSSAIGDRDILFRVDPQYRFRIPVKQPPSTRARYILSPQPQPSRTDREYWIHVPLPVRLEAGGSVYTETINRHSADLYENLIMNVTKWVRPYILSL